MNKKQIATFAPEIYLILSVTTYWALTGTLFNPIAIFLLATIIIQLFVNNRIFGSIISVLLIILNLYMVLAMLSELNEFPTFSARAKELLIFGSSYLGLNILMGVIMARKYFFTFMV